MVSTTSTISHSTAVDNTYSYLLMECIHLCWRWVPTCHDLVQSHKTLCIEKAFFIKKMLTRILHIVTTCVFSKKMHLHSTGGQSYHKHPQVRLCAFSQAVTTTPLAYMSVSVLSSHSCLKWVYQLLLFFTKYETSHHRMIWLSQVP